MRFLAGENFPAATVRALQEAGHDVARAMTTSPGISDLEVLAWMVHEGRILLTFDKGFGELARHAGLPAACGILLFRVPMPAPDDVGRWIADLVTARDDWAGHFSVIEPGRLRMRRIR